MSGIQTNRSNINLPAAVATEILDKMKGSSAVMQLATETPLPGLGKEIPVILGDPQASWVSETGKKPVSNPELSKKILRPYKLAVIVPFSMEFKRDVNQLYSAVIERLPGALGEKFDATVFGAAAGAPGTDFDTLGAVTGQSIAGSSVYDAFADAVTDVAIHGAIANGIAISPQGIGTVLKSKTTTGQPLFNSAPPPPVPQILSCKTVGARGAYVAGSGATPADYAFVGDWTKAVFGTVNGVEISFSDQATLTVGDETINLWEQNMVAVRAEIEVGFRALTDCFNKVTA